MVIRVVARGEDLASALARLHAEAHDDGMALGALATPPAGLEAAYRRTLATLDGRDRLLLVAADERGLVGMAQLVRSEADNARHRAEVRRVAVADRARSHGVGRALMAAVEEAARERGMTLLWLTTHARTPACGFYEAIGYTELGVMPNYSSRPDGSPADGAFYYRELA